MPARPFEELSRIRETQDKLIFVDFDHTLFASNSTEVFIANCSPAPLVAVLEFCIRRCIPWRFLGIRRWGRIRDYVLCMALAVFLPWNVFRWRKRAHLIFEENVSGEVVCELDMLGNARIVIVSFGMSFIIRAMLERTRWATCQLIATPLLAHPFRLLKGKGHVVLAAFGSESVANATLVTDSLDDADLLELVRTPILIRPQGALFSAIERLYIPLRYTARAKYTASYLVDQVLLVDIMLLVLATAVNAYQWESVILVVAPLSLALMCIYELGYYENDMVAAKSEEKPVLSERVEAFRAYPIKSAAWLWAALFSIGGFLSLTNVAPSSVTPEYAIAWAVCLLALRLTFAFYNRSIPSIRTNLYPFLQLFKYAPIMMLLTPTVPGVISVLCQVVMMTAIYIAYRIGGRKKEIKRETFRTILIAIGMILLATNESVWDKGALFSAICLFAWSALRMGKASVLSLAKVLVHRLRASRTSTRSTSP